jgi:hypothetical protein
MAFTTPGTAFPSAVLTSDFWNTNVRDNLTEVAPFFSQWTAYTPALTGSITNPTLGSGSTAVGFYMRVGKIVWVRFLIAFGTSGAAAGNGNYAVSLPVSSVSYDARVPVGVARLNDDSAATIANVFIHLPSTTVFQFRFPTAWPTGALQGANQASPWNWAASDSLAGELFYEAA